MNKTQTQKIFNWLESGHSITPLEALLKFGCLRLGARIYDLRRQGFDIATNYVTRNGKTFAEYKLNAN